jgi:PAS domain S-box-containing protein
VRASLEHSAEEIKRLQRCINDLVSVLALPAMWAGGESSQVISTLLDVLMGMLRLDLVYVRLNGSFGEAPFEMARRAPSLNLTARPREIGELLDQRLGDDLKNWSALVRNRIGDGDLSLVPLAMGLQGEIGVIVAGSQRADFPGQAERLVLSVAANQAVIGLQEARLLSKQKLVASELDRRVSERTKELAEAENNFRQIVNSIPGLVCTMSPDGEVQLLNRPLLEYFGKTSTELKDWALTDAVHPDDLPRVIAAFTSSIGTGNPYDIEHRCRRADGVYRWFQVRALPVHDADGRITGWYVLLTDIDDRKRAEEALRASECDLSSIINTIPMLAWSARPDGFCDFLNQRWLDFTGLSAEQARGWCWEVVIHPDDAKGLLDSWQMALVSGQLDDVEARMRRFDGEYRWFLLRASPLRDKSGTIVKWYGTNTDIDDRKRAEEELQRSEAFLAEGQRLSLSGSFLWRLDTDEITFSEQLYRTFEFDRDTPVTLERIGSRVHSEDIPLLTDKIETARSGNSDLNYEIRLQMPNGSVKYLRTIARRTRDRDGRPEIMGAVQDVTERRLSEEVLGKVRSELAHMTRVTSLGALTASIAHEVNQPLAGIVTNASTCLRMLSTDPPNVDGARETARRTIRDGNRASEVITRLRALFSKKDTTTEPVDLSEATREVIALSLNDLKRAGVILRAELADDLPPVTGDRIQLQQVVLNLLLNASDAMSCVEGRPRHLVVRTERDEDDCVRTTVQDSGVGIDPKNVDRVFDSFYTTKNAGMGMGLSVSRSIIESHHGRLWVTPNDGPGTTFSFSLPRAPEAATGASPHAAIRTSALTDTQNEMRNP